MEGKRSDRPIERNVFFGEGKIPLGNRENESEGCDICCLTQGECSAHDDEVVSSPGGKFDLSLVVDIVFSTWLTFSLIGGPPPDSIILHFSEVPRTVSGIFVYWETRTPP
ncbi:hypothetical protein NPIL_96501 [Nephila pilipes]|uniref:Uncharacterized protein n=1 Tax=Nephila pilipes TaxID=299642 RepID=A0A8X6MWX9_NEPPI|nr:hypothetical protein NPIL_96501 [Nephila pilipes]